MRSGVAVSVGALLLVLAACSGAASTSPPSAAPATAAPATSAPSAAGTDIEIYAASSLKAALAQIETAYEAANPGLTLTISTDASSALETKIEQGGPADVFLSADTANPQKLVEKGLAAGPAVAFAGNMLTIIVPKDNPAGIQTPADLSRPGVKIIAAGDAVPITKYANTLVDNLAKAPDYPADFATAYKANIVSQEENVGAVVGKIAIGEGDAAIVYVTDAKSSKDVLPVPVTPGSANVLATYAGVVVKDSPDVAASNAFMTWLTGPGGQAILSSFGFLSPS